MADLLPLRSDPCPRKTRSDLELDRVLAALAARCASTLGAELARDLPFGESRADVRRLLAAAQEARRLHDKGELIPAAALGDPTAALGRLRVGGVLAPEELRALAALASAARTLRKFVQTRRATAPTLHEECATDPSLDEVADEVSGAFDPAGTLADHASPRLRELRGEYAASRLRMLSRLDELMNRYEAILQDRFVTEREGRYVVPVRSDAHERFPGIVHATSASGATLFVEPRAVVPMGNRLKMLEADVQREEYAVYARLSGLFADVHASLEAAADALAIADVRAATAKLGQDLGLNFPDVTDAPNASLMNARHPLLLLDAFESGQDRKSVVPSDLVLTSGRAVVVSGPNAGGKTVALKALGLAALMTRAGLPVACGDGSAIGIYDVVLTDVGDDQSLHKNLSTFSAHVQNLVSILSDAQPGALVLLDELAGGTDPREGEALAAGVLDSLCARGAAACATTHYEGLKALALADDRFENASVGFDLATMTPTFRLALGVPGSSSALAVARRFGMPSTVIERAERFVAHDDRRFETIVQKVNDERAALDMARQAAITRAEEAETAKHRYEAELATIRAREERMVSKETEALLSSIRRAKEDLRNAQSRLRARKADEAALKDAQRAVDRVAGELALGGQLEHLIVKPETAPRTSLGGIELRKGMRVYVPRIRADAEVVDLLPNGQVRVAAGSLKLTVAAADLRTPDSNDPVGSPSFKSTNGRTAQPEPATFGDAVLPTRDNSIDLRGLRVDDAIPLAVTFLDRSLNQGRRIAFLIHGHGTGAVRDALRRELKDNRYVARFRPGEGNEGGDGVTVVTLT